MNAKQQRIMELLRAHPAGLTSAKIAQLSAGSLPRDLVYQELALLEAHGEVDSFAVPGSAPRYRVGEREEATAPVEADATP